MTLDDTAGRKFTGMWAFTENGKAHIAAVNDHKSLLVYTYKPPDTSMI